MLPAEVSIIPVPDNADQTTIQKGVSFATLQRVIGNKTYYLQYWTKTG
jgi:hypothetical protein